MSTTRRFPLAVLARGSVIGRYVELGHRPSRDIVVMKTRIGIDARIRSHAVIYSNCVIGDEFETGHHVVIREENVLGDRVWIWSHSTIDYGCQIGHRSEEHTSELQSQR